MYHINTYFLSSYTIKGLDILRHPNYPAHLNRKPNTCTDAVFNGL